MMRQLLLAFTLISVLASVAAPAEAAGTNGPLRPAAEPVVLKVERDAQWSPTGFDPMLILFSRGACESDSVDIELWSRDLEEWVPHPRHARLATGSCNPCGSPSPHRRTVRWSVPSAASRSWKAALKPAAP